MQNAVFYSFEIIRAIHVFGRSDRDFLPCAVQTDKLYLGPILYRLWPVMPGVLALCVYTAYIRSYAAQALPEREKGRLFFYAKEGRPDAVQKCCLPHTGRGLENSKKRCARWDGCHVLTRFAGQTGTGKSLKTFTPQESGFPKMAMPMRSGGMEN